MFNNCPKLKHRTNIKQYRKHNAVIIGFIHIFEQSNNILQTIEGQFFIGTN